MVRGNLPILDEFFELFPRAVEQIRYSFGLDTTLILGGYANPAAAATSWCSHLSENKTAENEVELELPFKCLIKNMRVVLATAPVGAETIIATLRKNAADSALTVTLTGASTAESDSTNEIQFAAGDTYALSVVASAAAAANPHCRITMECYRE